MSGKISRERPKKFQQEIMVIFLVYNKRHRLFVFFVVVVVVVFFCQFPLIVILNFPLNRVRG